MRTECIREENEQDKRNMAQHVYTHKKQTPHQTATKQPNRTKYKNMPTRTKITTLQQTEN